MRRSLPAAGLALALLCAGAGGDVRAQGGAPEAALLPPGARGAAEAADDAVAYTVDPALEERIREILATHGVPLAHVVVLDPRSGEVLAYVSTDPERFPATRPYPAASLMKVVTGAAVLRNAPRAAEHPCRYVGSPYALQPALLEPPAHGGVVDTFAHALAISNNQCFARWAVHDVGAEALLAEIRALGLLEPPGPGHAEGRVRPAETPLALGHLGSGLAGSWITPLAAARLAAVLARGELVEPHWIAGLRDAEGHLHAAPMSAPPRAVWPPEVADALRELLVQVTERGTARSAFLGPGGVPRLGGVRVAGKTGTLRGHEPEGLYRWFIGVGPAEAPSIALATLVVDGPRSATEIAADVLGELFCGGGPCAPSGVETLHARARARANALAQEIAAAAALAATDVAAAPPAPETAERTAAGGGPERVAESGELVALPRPVATAGFDFPRRLLQRKVRGEIVLLLELTPEGEVREASVQASDLPEFEPFVLGSVQGWRFTPPTREGRPVAARARLPIPIRVN